MFSDLVPDQERKDEVTDHGHAHAHGLLPDPDRTEGQGGRGLKQ